MALQSIRNKNDACFKNGFCVRLGILPSLNTQSCFKGFLVIRNFCLWAFWAARPVLKKEIWANYEQLMRAFFSCFQGQKKIYIFFFKQAVSVQKSCIISLF